MVRPFTVLWVFLLLQFAVVEWAAYKHGGYAATATGHLVSLMLGNAWLFILVPLVFVGVAIHLLADAVRLGK